MAATSRAHFGERCGACASCSRTHCSAVGTRFCCRVAGGRGVRRGARSPADGVVMAEVAEDHLPSGGQAFTWAGCNNESIGKR
jgi:hypothetical protein